MVTEICNSCLELYGCICLAQYKYNNCEAYICEDCYTDGWRAYMSDVSLEIYASKSKLSVNHFPAPLYWDEGLRVTKGKEKIWYKGVSEISFQDLVEKRITEQ